MRTVSKAATLAGGYSNARACSRTVWKSVAIFSHRSCGKPGWFCEGGGAGGGFGGNECMAFANPYGGGFGGGNVAPPPPGRGASIDTAEENEEGIPCWDAPMLVGVLADANC